MASDPELWNLFCNTLEDPDYEDLSYLDDVDSPTAAAGSGPPAPIDYTVVIPWFWMYVRYSVLHLRPSLRNMVTTSEGPLLNVMQVNGEQGRIVEDVEEQDITDCVL